MESRFDIDSTVKGDNDFTRFAEEAVLKARELRVIDPSRVPEDIGVDSVD